MKYLMILPVLIALAIEQKLVMRIATNRLRSVRADGGPSPPSTRRESRRQRG